MNNQLRKWLFLVAISILAGCTVSSPPRSVIEPLFCEEKPAMDEMDEMLAFYESARKQSPADLGRTYDKAKQGFAQSKSDANRARLALLLILPNTQFRDLSAALHLLSEWPRDTKPASLQSFRHLLAGMLTEQQRLSHSVEELSQKLKDEQNRVEMLQSQIDAIKNMEKDLLKEL